MIADLKKQLADGRLKDESQIKVISSYAFSVPTSAAVPEIGKGPATMILASAMPAVASAFLYIPTVQ